MNSPRGSEWRKWDLHFHTPSSGDDYEHKGARSEELIEILKNHGIACVAVTDHNVIDITRIEEMTIAAGKDLVVFPGIELRTELGGSKSVHITGIFPEDSDVGVIWGKLNVLLKIEDKCGRYEDGRFSGNPNSFYVDHEEAAKVIHDLGGLVTVHAGQHKSNSLEEISNEPHKQRLKTDLLRESVDILEVGRLHDIAYYRSTVFPNIGFRRPIIICSDNHDIREYQPKAFCWIKGDTSFCGLRQILLEPEDRIFIGDMPPKLRVVKEKPTIFLDSIEIRKDQPSTFRDNWFDANIPLNPGLVAVIGRKGSGKSALADILALCCNARQEENFAFLTKDRFRAGKDCLAKHFLATLTWVSGYSVAKRLNESIDTSVHESVRYIPQNFLESVCNAPAGADKTSFDRELEKVVFSHVDRAERLGCESLQDLLERQVIESDRAITTFRAELHELNKRIETYEYQSTADYRKGLEEKLKLLRDRLGHHTKNKPPEVPQPPEASNPECAGKQKELTEAVEEREGIIAAVAEQEKRKKQLTLKLNSAVQLEKRLERLRNFFETVKAESCEDVARLGLSFDDIAKIEIHSEKVAAVRTEISANLKDVYDALDPNAEGGPASKKRSLDVRIQEITAEVEAPAQQYQRYLESLAVWEEQKKTMVGTVDEKDSIQGLEASLSTLGQVPSHLVGLQADRSKKVGQIHNEMRTRAAKYRDLYKPVQNLVETGKIIQEQKKLEFKVSIVDNGFRNGCESLIAVSRSEFKSIEAFETFVTGALSDCNFNDCASIERLLEAFLDKMKIVRNLSIQDGQKVAKFMSQHTSLVDLYDFLFGLEYLDTRYRLRYDGKELEQLAPGEKGTLLLMFYLLVDNSDCPLIIDQPEENIDNETVYGVLVPCIREAKKSRQVILITHNPNLAVVCDAEQIIHAEIHKENGIQIRYTSGAIECPTINAHLVNVLEGTRPAFDKRDQKYRSVMPRE